MTLPVALKEKKDRAELIYAEVNRLLTDPDVTLEEKGGIEAMIAEADDLSSELFQLDKVQAAHKKLQDIARQHESQQAEAAGQFKTLGEFLKAVHSAGVSKKHDPRLVWYEDEAPTPGESKDLAEGDGATGGFLVPSEAQINPMSIAAEQSFFWNRATRIPMRRRSIEIPVLDQTGTTAGQPHWFGGIQAYWAAEASEMSNSDPAFRQITLTAHELIAFTRASNTLLADSATSLEAFFNSPLGFNGAMSWMFDYEAINGTGVGKPTGFLNSGATITVPRATAGTVEYPDLLNMLQKFLMTGGQGMWLASQSLLSTLAQINGPSGNPSYVWLSDASGGIPARLLGMPIYFTEKMPLIGTAGDLALVNAPYYLVGDRQAITIESTQFEQWKFNKHSWRAVARVDGQPWLSAPLTLQDGTSQLSPFVILGDLVS